MGFFCRRLPRFATLVLTVFLVCLLVPVGLPGLAFAVDPAYLVDGIAADDELSPDDEFVSGYIPDTLPAPSIHDGEAGDELLRGTVDIPPSYDSRDQGLVTSPKNQGSFGTCWAFATMGVLESSLLSRGMVESTIDLSERHLAYFLYHTAPDPLGNTAGDSTVAINPQAVKPADGSDYPAYPVGYLVNGANATMACYTLASWTGVARENAPGLGTYDELLSAYNDAGRVASDVFLDQVALDAGLSHSVNSFHLTQMRRIPLADADDVKQAIMDNGAVFLSLYYTRNYLNKNTGAYYYSGAGGKGSNHAVIAVGWDDDYSRDNFNSNSKPTSDGAWICKNSYGSDGVDSYFYVSYEDWLVAPRPSDDFNPVTFAMEAEPADALDNNYQYDGTVAACYNLIESGGSLASVFVAQANEGGYERLKAISLSLSSANVAYSVQVYVNPTDPSDPTSGTPSLAQPVEGTTDYAGYYTVDLGAGVALDEGDVFAVVVTLSCDEEFVKYNVDCTYGIKERYDTKNRGYYCIAHVEPGQSFERETVGADWDDLSLKLYDEYGDGIEDEPACCARIKAFTVNEEIEQVNDLANAQVEAIADQRYTGEELTPDVVVTYENRVLRKDRDYQVSYADNVEGTAQVTIVGAGRYFGTLETSFQIVYIYDIANAQVEAIDDQRYTGEELTPDVVVTYEGTTLQKGCDYLVSYDDNLQVGTAKVTIEGIGSYEGTLSATFEIYADPTWSRLWGNVALDTMQAIVQADGVFDASTVDTVVVATAGGFKDALAAAGLAGRLDAPVLITPGTSLATQTAAELRRLDPSRVVVAGGPVAVSDSVFKRIQQTLPAADVQRVSGQTAVDTALALWRAGDGWGETAVVVTSDGYKDALSIAPFAYAKGAPIFLAKPSKTSANRVLSDETKTALVEGGFTRVVIVGGTLAVAGGDKGVEGQIAGIARSCGRAIEVVRLPGANAIDTSKLVAQFELGEGMGLTHMAVATTASYKDALCGAPLAGAQNSVLVLVGKTGGFGAYDGVYDSNKVVRVNVLGGPAAISEASWKHITAK